MSEFLVRLMGDERTLKLGFMFSHDVFRLRQSYPHWPCFAKQNGAGYYAAREAEQALQQEGLRQE